MSLKKTRMGAAAALLLASASGAIAQSPKATLYQAEFDNILLCAAKVFESVSSRFQNISDGAKAYDWGIRNCTHTQPHDSGPEFRQATTKARNEIIAGYKDLAKNPEYKNKTSEAFFGHLNMLEKVRSENGKYPQKIYFEIPRDSKPAPAPGGFKLD